MLFFVSAVGNSPGTPSLPVLRLAKFSQVTVGRGVPT
jgi:hypothetical protein